MGSLGRLFTSSVGRKYLMAGSGVVLFLFLVGHLLGNLQLFLGPERFNGYVHFVGSWPITLWVMRVGLLGLTVLHVWCAAVLTLENRAGRPIPYDRFDDPATSYAARTMMLSGIIVGVFLVGHLLHYSLRLLPARLTGTEYASLTYRLESGVVCHDAHRMVVLGLGEPALSVFYLFGVALLCWHLSHGLGAMFQSVGLKNHAWTPVIDRGGVAVSILLFAGYASIPVAVLLGFVR